jgi:TPR repeat protein
MKKLFCTLSIVACLFSQQSFASENAQDEGKVIYMSTTNYQSGLDLGLVQVKQNRFEEAFKTMMLYAQYGEKIAQYVVSTYLLSGKGTEQDITQGLVWLALASEQEQVEWKDRFTSITSKLTPEQMAYLNEQIALTKAKYGAKAQFMFCALEREKLGSNLQVHRCKKYVNAQQEVKIRQFN